MSTSIKIRADGVVLHKHPTASNPERDFHPAKEVHRNDDAHVTHNAAAPTNADWANAGHTATSGRVQSKADLKAQYALLLTGQVPQWQVDEYKALKAGRVPAPSVVSEAEATAQAAFANGTDMEPAFGTDSMANALV